MVCRQRAGALDVRSVDGFRRFTVDWSAPRFLVAPRWTAAMKGDLIAGDMKLDQPRGFGDRLYLRAQITAIPRADGAERFGPAGHRLRVTGAHRSRNPLRAGAGLDLGVRSAERGVRIRASPRDDRPGRPVSSWLGFRRQGRACDPGRVRSASSIRRAEARAGSLARRSGRARGVDGGEPVRARAHAPPDAGPVSKDEPYAERNAGVGGSAGNNWWIATHIGGDP